MNLLEQMKKSASKPATAAVKQLQKEIKEELYPKKFVKVDFRFCSKTAKKVKTRPELVLVANQAGNKVTTCSGDVFETKIQNGQLVAIG